MPTLYNTAVSTPDLTLCWMYGDDDNRKTSAEELGPRMLWLIITYFVYSDLRYENDKKKHTMVGAPTMILNHISLLIVYVKLFHAS
jgi:hypothetical protein